MVALVERAIGSTVGEPLYVSDSVREKATAVVNHIVKAAVATIMGPVILRTAGPPNFAPSKGGA